MDTTSPLHPRPSEGSLASLLQLDPTPMADSPTPNNMDKPLPRTPRNAEEKAIESADERPHRGTTGPISFRTSSQPP